MKKVAIKAICYPESSMDYGAINYDYPITIGSAQWYGSRAGAILRRMKKENSGEWKGVPSSFDKDLDAHGDNDEWWTTRYLTREEGEALRPVMRKNVKIQNDQTIKDLDEYINLVKGYGWDINKHTEALLLWFSAYHQIGRNALPILSSVPVGASIDQMFNAIVAHRVAGQYRSRYEKCRDIIKNKDTEGVEGGVEGGSTSGGGDGTQEATGMLKYARIVGSQLFVTTRNGTAVGMPTPLTNMWTFKSSDPAAGGSGGSASGATGTVAGGSELQQKVAKWMLDRVGKFAYSQSPGRLDPDNTGYSDCSGTVWRAYHDVANIDIGTGGTGEIMYTGSEALRGAGPMSDAQVAQLKPGDLIVMMWNAGFRHVEMSTGGAGHVGHGGPGNGPIVSPNIASYVSNTAWWTVRRYIS